MEHYTFNCGQCGATYNYVGFKTGFGKTEAQLRQIADERHVCRMCGYDDRIGGGPKNDHDLDYGDNPSTETARFAANRIADLVRGRRG